MLFESDEYVKEMISIGHPEYLKIMDKIIEYKIHEENDRNKRWVKSTLKGKYMFLSFIDLFIYAVLNSLFGFIIIRSTIPSIILLLSFIGLIFFTLRSLLLFYNEIGIWWRYTAVERIVEGLPKEMIEEMSVEIHAQMLEEK